MIARKDPVVYSLPDTRAPLSGLEIENYRKQGFIVINKLFPEKTVTAWQEELDKLRNNPAIQGLEQTITEPGSHAVRSIFAVHRLSSLFDALSRNSRLVEIARYLLDDLVYLHQSRLNYKPGFRGKEFYWHSDFETWHTEDGMPAMRAVSMSVTLTRNDSTNGPLLLIPGSHREFLACEGETPEQHFKSSLKQQRYGVPDDENLSRLVAANGITEFGGDPGSVCIFDCNILHGSNSNISPYSRANLFFVYNALKNRVDAPYCGQPPRPEYICSRDTIASISTADEMV